MALTAAERQKSYRARRNQDPEKRKKYLEKLKHKYELDRMTGKRLSVSEMSEEVKQQKREQWRIYKHRNRLAQKMEESSELGNIASLESDACPQPRRRGRPRKPVPQKGKVYNELRSIDTGEDNIEKSCNLFEHIKTEAIEVELPINDNTAFNKHGKRTLSSAERVRRYRERRDSDPEKREKYLNKLKHRYLMEKISGKKKPISELTEAEKLEKRKEWRRLKEKSRDKSKVSPQKQNATNSKRFQSQESEEEDEEDEFLPLQSRDFEIVVEREEETFEQTEDGEISTENIKLEFIDDETPKTDATVIEEKAFEETKDVEKLRENIQLQFLDDKNPTKDATVINKRRKKPLTIAERQKKYREKRDSNPLKRQEYLNKQKHKYAKEKITGKKKSINELTEIEKRHIREKWRQAKKYSREKSKGDVKNDTPVQPIAINNQRIKTVRINDNYVDEDDYDDYNDDAAADDDAVADDEQIRDNMNMMNTPIKIEREEAEHNCTNSDAINNADNGNAKKVKKKRTPLSTAEKQKRYRERRNSDPQKRQEYLNKMKMRYLRDRLAGKKKLASEMTASELLQQREYWRKLKKQHRTKCRNKKLVAFNSVDGKRPVGRPRKYMNVLGSPDASFQSTPSGERSHEADKDLNYDKQKDSKLLETVIQTERQDEGYNETMNDNQSAPNVTICGMTRNVGYFCKTRLSPAEKQKRYRERRNNDPQKRQEYLKKMKMRNLNNRLTGKRKLVSEMTPSERRQQRKYWRKLKREHRNRKMVPSINVDESQNGETNRKERSPPDLVINIQPGIGSSIQDLRKGDVHNDVHNDVDTGDNDEPTETIKTERLDEEYEQSITQSHSTESETMNKDVVSNDEEHLVIKSEIDEIPLDDCSYVVTINSDYLQDGQLTEETSPIVPTNSQTEQLVFDDPDVVTSLL